MTNQEYKDFLIKKGAYPDFEIVNSPVFDIIEIFNGRKRTRALQVGSSDVDSNNKMINFINIINKPNDNWYIYNDTGSTKPFYFIISKIRCCCVPSVNRLNKHRLKKIKEIKNNINGK